MILKRMCFLFFSLMVLSIPSCVVVTTAVGLTTTVVGGAIDVVDAVTPDIIDDNDD